MSHHQVQFHNWTETYQLGKVFQLNYFVQEKSYFEKHLEASLYHLQIKFKHKIPLSSSIHYSILQRLFTSGKEREKGSFLQDNGEWNSVAKNDYIN